MRYGIINIPSVGSFIFLQRADEGQSKINVYLTQYLRDQYYSIGTHSGIRPHIYQLQNLKAIRQRYHKPSLRPFQNLLRVNFYIHESWSSKQ